MTFEKLFDNPNLAPVSVSTPVRGSGTPVKAMFPPQSKQDCDSGKNMALTGVPLPLTTVEAVVRTSVACENVRGCCGGMIDR